MAARLNTHESYANVCSTGNNKSKEGLRKRERNVVWGYVMGLVRDSNESKSNEII